jgi:hypothetical protein
MNPRPILFFGANMLYRGNTYSATLGDALPALRQVEPSRTLREVCIERGWIRPARAGDLGPTPLRWRDEPTLRLDDEGRREADARQRGL